MKASLRVIGLVLGWGVLGAGWAWLAADRDVGVRLGVLAIAQEQREYANTWFGIPVLQFPSDLWTYQELIDQVNPDVVIETGTYYGGLSCYLAMLLDYRNPHGQVITVDIWRGGWDDTVRGGRVKPHVLDRILFIEGSSTSPDVFEQIERMVGDRTVLVILDSLHTRPHVLRELELYSRLVSPRSYIVVNDTHHDRNADTEFQEGPAAAVRVFLETHPEFMVDPSTERFMVSSCHGGVLRRVR